MFYVDGLIRFSIWVGIVFTAASYTVFFAVNLAYNMPHAGDGGWMSAKYLQRVKGMVPTYISLGGLSMVTDLYALAIPLFSVAGLQMSLRKKLLVSALFATGLLYDLSTFRSNTAYLG